MRKILCLLCISLIVATPVTAQVIKLGSLAPEGSPWDRALRRIAADWSTASNGRLQVKVFAGGIAGDEPSMVRKIRINQLQAAAITGIGLGSIVEEIYAVQLPFLIRSTEEMEYVMAEMEWVRLMSEGLDLITGKVVSTDMVEEVKMHLEEYRQR